MGQHNARSLFKFACGTFNVCTDCTLNISTASRPNFRPSISIALLLLGHAHVTYIAACLATMYEGPKFIVQFSATANLQNLCLYRVDPSDSPSKKCREFNPGHLPRSFNNRWLTHVVAIPRPQLALGRRLGRHTCTYARYLLLCQEILRTFIIQPPANTHRY